MLRHSERFSVAVKLLSEGNSVDMQDELINKLRIGNHPDLVRLGNDYMIETDAGEFFEHYSDIVSLRAGIDNELY